MFDRIFSIFGLQKKSKHKEGTYKGIVITNNIPEGYKRVSYHRSSFWIRHQANKYLKVGNSYRKGNKYFEGRKFEYIVSYFGNGRYLIYWRTKEAEKRRQEELDEWCQRP
jgi:hypothetical protein